MNYKDAMKRNTEHKFYDEKHLMLENLDLSLNHLLNHSYLSSKPCHLINKCVFMFSMNAQTCLEANI